MTEFRAAMLARRSSEVRGAARVVLPLQRLPDQHQAQHRAAQHRAAQENYKTAGARRREVQDAPELVPKSGKAQKMIFW
mgnify:CR=1 FL=1